MGTTNKIKFDITEQKTPFFLLLFLSFFFFLHWPSTHFMAQLDLEFIAVK